MIIIQKIEMPKYILVIFIAFSNFCQGQVSIKKSGMLPDPVICYASGKTEKNYLPPPADILKKLKSGKIAASDIQVTYSLFPENAKTAFEYAVTLWENLIESPVPIRMKASWASMESGVLASCGSTDYFRNFEGAPRLNCYYTIAATEKIMGKELNGNGSDLEGTFNKDVEWYFGIDGQTPDSLYDFVSAVLHEIAHGLGFTGFFYTSGNRGGYGSSIDRTPSVYDSFVETNDQRRIVNASVFVNPSFDIYNALTSNSLYSGSPVAVLDGEGSRPRLYAPRPFNDGSSVYHLNESTYPSGNINALMTHASGKGEAIHNPGPLTNGIIADLGWKNLKIKFEKPSDVEFPLNPIVFEASIVSDYPIDTTSLYLVYSFDKFKTRPDSLPLLPDPSRPALFSTRLSLTVTKGTIYYFLKANDSKKRIFSQPVDAPNYVYDIKIGPDTIKPSIIHDKPDFIFSNVNQKSIRVKATDNIGIDTVYIEYSINDKIRPSFGLTEDSVSSFSGFFNLSDIMLHGGDSIRYRIVARDNSSNANQKIMPESGFYSFKVEEIYNPVIKYYNDFNSTTGDFIKKDFQIITDIGFSDGALHSSHPYPSPDKDDTYLNFMTYLRYPVILKQGESMSYDEVVLIEPGDSGTKYGDFGFWDYAIVEGSKDKGETWLPLVDGYDSGSNQAWLYNYYLNISGNNSTTNGKKEWFVNRKINLLENGNFSAGDTVIIRFRILSDPYAHGWGWVIDNLSIQIPVSAPGLTLVSPGNVLIYPNPFNSKINVKIENDRQLKDVRIEVFNQFGQLISLIEDRGYATDYLREIDLGNLSPGIYIVVISENSGKILTQKVIKQQQ